MLVACRLAGLSALGAQGLGRIRPADWPALHEAQRIMAEYGLPAFVKYFGEPRTRASE